MYISRPSSKNKNLTNNIIKNFSPKTMQLLTTNTKKKQNNISFIPFSLFKSRSLVPYTTNTSRNQKFSNLKKSFESLYSNQISIKNSITKNKSLINSLLRMKSKSKNKSKPKKGISTKKSKSKINNLKDSSNLNDNDFIRSILLFRKKNKNKNSNMNANLVIKKKNNKSLSNNYNSNVNYSKSRSNSIRCSLTYVNRYSYITKPEKTKLKYDDYTCITSNGKSNNNYIKKINEIIDQDKNKKNNNDGNNNDNKNNENNVDKWPKLLNKLKNLKLKTNYLLNKYLTLSSNLYNELEMINQNCGKKNLVNNKSYDYRKKYLIYNKNEEVQGFNDFLSNRYVNTDINNN